jgi:hypothetical protein
MLRALAATFTAILLTGCAGLAEPDWLVELRAREAEPLPLQTVASTDGFFTAEVPAPAGWIESDETAYHVSFDAGTESPIDCWIYRDGIDFAGSLSRLSEETFGAISEHLGEVKRRQIEKVDAGALAASPYLAVDWLYLIEVGGERQIGQIKHLVASREGRGVYCQHNEVGYAATFRRVVGALLGSLEYGEPAERTPFYAAVSTMSVRGMRVGVEYTTLTRDGEIDTRVDRRTSVLLPVTGDTLQVSDTFAVEFARPDGTLINQVHVESSDGELVSNLELAPEEAGAWVVEGTFQGKKLQARIDSSKAPSSWLGESLALRSALAESPAGASVTSTRWVPEADPTRLLDGTVTVERRIDAEHFAAKVDAAGLEADVVVNRAGTVTSGSVDMGMASMHFEQVYAHGAF